MDLKKRLDKRLNFQAQNLEKIYSLISEIDIVKGQWRLSQKLSPQMVSRLQKSVLITSTGASTRIEGSKLTDKEVEGLLTKMRVKKFKTRDEQEVAGYLELLEKIFDSYKTLTFSESFILSLHKELLNYSQKDEGHKGKYKTSSNRVEARNEKGELVGVVFNPSEPYLVAKEMKELVEWTKEMLEKGDKHPILIISNFLFEFLAIHPFQDGNGRLSRILTNFLLLKSGYEYIPFISHEKIVEDNKIEYYLALNKVQQTWKTENEELSFWVLFFLETIKTQSNEALKLLTKEDVESFLSEKQNQVWQFALEKKEFTKKEVVETTKLSIRTVENSLKKLVDMKKLERLGEGRGIRYRVLK